MTGSRRPHRCLSNASKRRKNGIDLAMASLPALVQERRRLWGDEGFR